MGSPGLTMGKCFFFTFTNIPDDYLKARNMCTALADDSEITDEGPVKRKRKKRTFSSSEDEDQAKSSLPSPPPPPKNSKGTIHFSFYALLKIY